LDAPLLQGALQMGAFSLPRPKTLRSGAVIARQVIPADIRDDYKQLYGVVWEERWRAEPGTPAAECKRRYGEWNAEITGRFEALRAAKRGDGINLSFKDAVALAGEWYTGFVARYEDDPGRPGLWGNAVWMVVGAMLANAAEAVRGEGMRGAMLANAPEEVLGEGMRAHPWWDRDPKVRAAMRAKIADVAKTAQFLANRGIALTNDARTLFLDCVLDKLIAAFSLLERRAQGDYVPDQLPASFPKFTGAPARPGDEARSPWRLFEGWVAARNPAAATVARWRAAFLDLEANFGGPGAQPLTADTAQAWTKTRITDDRSAKTVRDAWVGAAHAIYEWAKAERLIPNNPFAAVSVTVPHEIRNRESKAFTDDEARTILRAATTAMSDPAKRWVPWLCAYSGARAGEITQLRGSDIERRGNFYVMKLKPEAGSIKTGEARTVPLHEHIIEQGFLDFVHGRGNGPPFYENDSTANQAADDPMRPKQPPALRVRMVLAYWVRRLGISDPEVAPNHAWRHTFKQIAQRSGIDPRVHDRITGHAAKTVAEKYGQATAEDMAAALKKFPRYEI
jgi:integrase